MTAWRPPNCLSVCSRSAFIAASEVTLSELANALPPPFRISSATFSAGPAEPSSPPCRPPPRSFTTTEAPSFAAINAQSRPIPLPPPVTQTTFPSNTPIMSSVVFSYCLDRLPAKHRRCRAEIDEVRFEGRHGVLGDLPWRPSFGHSQSADRARLAHQEDLV